MIIEIEVEDSIAQKYKELHIDLKKFMGMVIPEVLVLMATDPEKANALGEAAIINAPRILEKLRSKQ